MNVTTPLGVDPSLLYTKEGLCLAAGIKQPALTKAITRGLRVRRTCGRLFIRGQDFIQYVETVVEDGPSGHRARGQSKKKESGPTLADLPLSSFALTEELKLNAIMPSPK